MSDIQPGAANSPVAQSAGVGGATTGKEAAGNGKEAKQKSVSGSAGQPRRDKGSTIATTYGRRTLQAFPITRAELGELAGIGVAATLFFSIASGLFGFAISVYKDLSFNPSLARDFVDHWKDIVRWCFTFAGIFAVIGIILLVKGKSKISQIKSETTFPD